MTALVLIATSPLSSWLTVCVGLSAALTALTFLKRRSSSQPFEPRKPKTAGRWPRSSNAGPVAKLEGERVPDMAAVAAAAWRRGDLGAAERAARRAVATTPGDTRAHGLLGVIYRQTGRYAEAVAACRRAAALEPENATVQINLGVALRHLARLNEAEACYRRAIQLDPANAIAHSSLGVTLRRQGRDEEAEACYRLAIGLDPDYASAWLNLGIVLEMRGALAPAQEAYRRALELEVPAAA
jgi:Flp pilus assembly protein TadD